MLAVSIPNSATFPAFVDTATKCLATALTSRPRPANSHRRALSALVIVSSVVNVFRSEEHTSELQSHHDLVCRLLLEKKKKDIHNPSNLPGIHLTTPSPSPTTDLTAHR